MLKRVGGISQECVQNGGDRGKDQTRVQPARCLTPLQGLPGMLGARLGQKPGAIRGSPTVGYQLSHPWETLSPMPPEQHTSELVLAESAYSPRRPTYQRKRIGAWSSPSSTPTWSQLIH